MGSNIKQVASTFQGLWLKQLEKGSAQYTEAAFRRPSGRAPGEPLKECGSA